MAIILFSVGLMFIITGQAVAGSALGLGSMLAVVVAIKVDSLSTISIELRELLRVHLRFRSESPRRTLRR
jgi:hypothetical protein